MFLLVISEILITFVNTLTADDKYSPCNTETLRQPIQMQLFNKKWKKKNSKFFPPFLKFISNFEQFERKDDPHMLFISEITDCGRRA